MNNNQLQVLESVAVKGSLHGLCLELEVTQAFINNSERNIEAIYTFPLPFGAVLLDLKVKLGEKILTGAIFAKKQAESNYEEAITDGNSAIMLERADDGICTVNVGNLLAGERAEIRYRFSQLLNWQQDSLRINLPTTIAPRYGDPIKAGWQIHQVTDYSLLAEYPFSFVFDIAEPLSTALIECPSHDVTIKRDGEVARVMLASKNAWLDRDLILNIKEQGVTKDVGQFTPDGEQHVALASFSPKIPINKISNTCIKVVVDCSGSMAGDSIAQAKIGLLRILDNLRETDTFNIVIFGNTASAYFPKCVSATQRNLNQARMAVEKIEADLGGTEMAHALEFSYALKDVDDRPTSVLLITDGEVYEHEDIIQKAKQSKHRIFTVGVGSSVAEAFVRNLASATGGAAELVSPNEGMAETIFRQFSRMFQSRATSANIHWPNSPKWQSPKSIGAVFAGDTLHQFAGFDQLPAGEVCLQMELEDGSKVEQKLVLQMQADQSQELNRIAAAHRIEYMDDNQEDQATALALSYQLISKYTNYLIVEKRADAIKPTDLPELTQVQLMLAAGYGGSGRVDRSPIQFCVSSNRTSQKISRSQAFDSSFSDVDEYEIPAFLRNQSDSCTGSESNENTVIDNMVDSIKGLFTPKAKTLSAAIAAVAKSNNWYAAYLVNIRTILPNELISVIDSIAIKEGLPEKTVVASLILAILDQLGEAIARHEKRALVMALKREAPPASLIEFFVKGLILREKDCGWCTKEIWGSRNSPSVIPF